jgi:hypothetical protein
MNSIASTDPTQRQVLVNLGNRFAVFGHDGNPPKAILFNPEDSPILPRVADESEGAEHRIVETLQVSGMKRAAPGTEGTGADIEFEAPDGTRTLIEVKVRDGAPRRRDIDVGAELLKQAKEEGKNLEVWFFNLERLKLTVMRNDQRLPFSFDYFVPLNVWEKTREGVFERQRVVEEVEDWLRRVDNFYKDIQAWLENMPDLSFEQSRVVTMSEELMQHYAVVDRDLRVLDVMRDNQVIISFVPRGLWLIGVWGRIDMITKDRTIFIGAFKQNEHYEWKFASPGNRAELKAFDKLALLELLDGP